MFQTVFEAVSFESACINDETPKIHFCDASIIAQQITNTCDVLAQELEIVDDYRIEPYAARTLIDHNNELDYSLGF